MCVPVCRPDLKHTLADIKHRYVECAAAKIINSNGLILLFIQSISKRRCCRLVYNPLYIKACYLSRILCRLSLTVVKICRHSYNSLCNSLAEICLGSLFKLLQYKRRNLRRGVSLFHIGNINNSPAVFILYHLIRNHLHLFGYFIIISSHKSLYRKYGIFRVSNSLPFCHLAHKNLTLPRKGNNRRRNSASFLIYNNLWLTTLHNCNNRVCCAKVNTNNLSHTILLFCFFTINLFILFVKPSTFLKSIHNLCTRRGIVNVSKIRSGAGLLNQMP